MPAFGGFAGALPIRLTPESTTGWSAAQQSRFCSDLVALKRVAPVAVLTFTLSAGTLTLHSCWTMAGVGTAADSAPTLSTSGTGVILVAFDPQFADEYDISGAVNIRHARVTAHGATCIKPTVELVSPSSVRVRLFNSGGSAVDGKATLIVI